MNYSKIKKVKNDPTKKRRSKLKNSLPRFAIEDL